MKMRGDVIPVGDAAVLTVLGEAADEATLRQVWSLSATLKESLGESILEVTPAFTSVLVRFDPSVARLATIMACVRGALESDRAATTVESRTIDVNVCFGPEFSLDLGDVARHAGMSETDVVQVFCAPIYRVAFLGFIAGFPYLSGLPQALALPRLATPRVRVPAGSVALAAGVCGIYPRTSPGGWRIVGKTEADVFNVARSPAALFAPGDRVRFHPVSTIEAATATVSA